MEGFPPSFLANSFRFMHVNVSAAFIVIRACHRLFDYQIPQRINSWSRIILLITSAAISGLAG